MKSQLVAHRGLQPENTLFAYQQAFAKGFKVAECDVQVTRDGEFVLCHDNTLQRTACSESKHLQQDIATLDYAQIANVQVGDAQHQEVLPCLSALLAQLPSDVTLLLEIKFNDKAHLTALLKLIEPYRQHIIIISFDLAMLTALRQLSADIRILLLTTATDNAYQPVVVNSAETLASAMQLCQQYQFNGLGFEYSDFICRKNITAATSQYLCQLWYSERDAQTVKHIIETAEQAGIALVNVD